MLITTRATTTRARTAVISLTRSGVRSGSCRTALQNPVGREGPAGGTGGPGRPGGPGVADMTGDLAVRLARREPEHVTDAAEGVQQVRLGGVDLAAQHGDVRLHDPGVAAEVVVPDVVEDLHLGQHPVGVAHEVAQQLELGGGELDRLAGAPDLMAVLVQLEVGELQPGGRLAALAAG